MVVHHPGDALGILEVSGLVAAIAAADAMVKAAPVEIVSRVSAGAGLITIAVRGDVASVRAAVDEGSRVAMMLDARATVVVVGRPDKDVSALLAATPTPPTTAATPGDGPVRSDDDSGSRRSVRRGRRNETS